MNPKKTIQAFVIVAVPLAVAACSQGGIRDRPVNSIR